MTDAIDTIAYKGYRINIHADDWPINPLDDYGVEPGIEYRVNFGGHNNVVQSPGFEFIELTREQIKTGQHIIAGLLHRKFYTLAGTHESNGTLLSGLSNGGSHYRYEYGGDVVSYINDTLSVLFTDSPDDQATILELAGKHAIDGSSQGHSQGDYCDYIVYSSEPLTYNPLDEYLAYCWGNVYRYSIDLIDDYGDVVDESIESCGGYYGEYGSDTYKHMIDQAKEAIDSLVLEVA